jgi:AcrR family transcriptional regulator
MAEVGLRQRHATRARAAIVTAALDLFQARGFHATTIEEIAARADIAPRTFFRYFPTKEAVLFAGAAGQREQMAAALAERPHDEHPFLSLTSVVGDFADRIAGRREDFELLQKVACENPGVWSYEQRMLEAEMAQTLSGFVAGRLGVSSSTDPRPQVWAGLAMTSFRVALHLWLDGGQQGELRVVVERALGAAAAAMRALMASPSHTAPLCEGSTPRGVDPGLTQP